MCGLDKVLQTHVGRKTYVCYLYQKQVGIEVIATIVGHATCYTTLKYYAKMDKQTIFKELRKHHLNNFVYEKRITTSTSPEVKADMKKRSAEKTELILNTLRTTGI